MEQVQIVTCDPDIKTVADLKGQDRVHRRLRLRRVLQRSGYPGRLDLTESDINAQYQDFGNSADALQDGKIDAAFVVAGAPHRGNHHLGYC